MNGIWLTFLIAGLLTFGIRLSFIALLGRWNPPLALQRALRFVPPAVLTAIIFPELLYRGDSLFVSPANTRLLAGLLAALVAWRTKNVLLTIVVGMVALLVLQRFY
jgi:branched-subunit amino acid transport protein